MIALISLTDAGNIFKAHAVKQSQLFNGCEGFFTFSQNSIKEILSFVKFSKVIICNQIIREGCALSAHLSF